MSGYGCKFVHPLLKRHECPLCHLAMRNPMQTECGHLFCKDCLEPILKLRPPLCPLDNEPVFREGCFHDKACCREILDLEVYCCVCYCTGRLNIHEIHMHIIDWKQCPLCNDYVSRTALGYQKLVEYSMKQSKTTQCTDSARQMQYPGDPSPLQPEVVGELVQFSEEGYHGEICDHKKVYADQIQHTRRKRLEIQKRLDQVKRRQERQQETIQRNERATEEAVTATGVVTNALQLLPSPILQAADKTNTWTIKRFTQAQQSAVDGIQASVCSRLFSTQSGYKFRIIAYLNGDGIGEGTHLSLFIMTETIPSYHVMQTLKPCTITIVLVNPKGCNHVTGTITLQKCQASSIPKFICLENLKTFVQGDGITIRINTEE